MSNQNDKTIFDESKMSLSAPPLEKGCRPPNFKVGLFNNDPQFTCFPGDNSGVKVISATMDTGTFFYVLQQIVDLAKMSDSGEQVIKITHSKPIPKEKIQDPKIRRQAVAETLIGRDNEGVMWIAVKDLVKANPPLVRFIFEPNFYHKVSFKNGNADRGVISRAYACAWANMVGQLMSALLAKRGGDPAYKYKPEGGFGGGNKGGNSGGSYGGNNSANIKAADGNFNDDGFDDDGF